YELKWRGLLPVDLLACNLDQGQPNFPATVLPEFLEKMGVPHRIEYADTYSIVMDKVPQGRTYCALCSRLRRGNLFARLRMVTLYDRSAREHGLVFGTSNKTELLLGYGTQHGDMASAINPIGDLYKAQVVALSRHLGVPQAIVDRPPTADLWAGQTDEEELGFTYDAVDALLHRLVDRRMTPGRLVADGFPRDFVDHVAERVRRNQYKRRPPLVAKVAARTVNLDYRYARDWGT
ncbi:MAG: NAD(+) synthase, partial [Planctomycetota bacterium]